MLSLRPPILRALLCASASLAATAAAAAPAPPPAKGGTVSEVTVTAPPKIEPGAVVGDIKPDLQLQPEDIQSYGVSTITELLNELAPEIGSNSGRGGEGPAILLNGKRISGLNEVQNLPTEAILRVDILPEEAALKYGFSANQRVVNIVLKDHVEAVLADAQGGMATEGGGASGQGEAGVTRIHGEHRLNLDVKYIPVAGLTEAQRDLTSLAAGGPPYDLTGNVVPIAGLTQIDPALSALVGQPVTVAGVPLNAAGRPLTLSDFVPGANAPNVTDVRRYRSLVAQSQQLQLNAVYTQPIFLGISGTLNGTFTTTYTDADRGLPGVGLDLPPGANSPFQNPVSVERLIPGFGPLAQDSQAWTGHIGFSLNRDISSWRLAMTGNYNHSDTRNENDAGVDATALQAAVTAGTVSPFGALPPDLLSRLPRIDSRAKSDTFNVQFVASGALFNLPAGEVRSSVRLGATGSTFDALSTRGGIAQETLFTQSGGNFQGSLDVPLTSARNKVLPFLGDLTVNTHVGLQPVSGFGILQTLGYGLHWVPVQGLSILINQLHDQAAPSQQQTSAPTLASPNTRLFDFATGQTVDVTEITGGNPDLLADHRSRNSVRVTWQPWQSRQFILRADYNQIHYRDPITTFPAASAAIEAAFPDRFVRDDDGDLTQVDYRPVNFTSQDVSSLKWGFDFSMPIGPKTRPTPPPRAQIFQQLRRAGVAGQVGRRPVGPRPGADGASSGPPDGAASAPGAEGGPPGAGPGGPGPGGPGPGGGPGGGAGFAGRGPGGFGGRGGGGFRGGGRGGRQDGRLRISLFHTVYFADRFLVRPGGPVIDFLNGSPLNGAAGQVRNEVQAQINVAERGFGAELNADWKQGSTVIGGAADGGDLNFSDLLKVNARLFADLNQRKTLIQEQPWLKGVRISVSVSNIFDQRQKVTDPTGATPLNFQPAYLDPLGRTWRIEFRKLFTSGT